LEAVQQHASSSCGSGPPQNLGLEVTKDKFVLNVADVTSNIWTASLAKLPR